MSTAKQKPSSVLTVYAPARRLIQAFPPGRTIPRAYLDRVDLLIRSRLPLAATAGLSVADLNPEPERVFRKQALFWPGAADRTFFPHRTETCCPSCGAPALITLTNASLGSAYRFCSDRCFRAFTLLANDLALSLGQKRILRAPRTPSILLSLPRGGQRQITQRLRMATTQALQASYQYRPNAYLASRALTDDPYRALGLSTFLAVPYEHLSKGIRTVMASPPAVVTDALAKNPVLAKATDTVLRHLDTADAILAGTAPHHGLAPRWTREQTQLFLGLYNKVVPTISASVNLGAAIPEDRDPKEMTHEELQALAASVERRRARETAVDAETTDVEAVPDADDLSD